MQNDKNHDGRAPAGKDIDGIMGEDVDGGKAQEYIHGNHDPEEPSATGFPGQEHQDGGDADMAAGEGCRGALAGSVGVFHHVVEETVAPSGQRDHLLMVGEVVA